VDEPAPDAFERRPVVVDPVDVDAARRERAQVRVGLGLAPGDVGDPELGVPSFRWTSPRSVAIDLAVRRERRRDVGASLEVPRDRRGGGDAVETMRAVAHDQNLGSIGEVCSHGAGRDHYETPGR
jgi:hypothetical protein